ncbi:GMC oxidoreductase [Cronobacter turicensis]|uniref:GMC oxidoreductase n=1 Tax=unclassified Cronobacter TaxID=2649764 RepID=UPI0013EB810C|nr:MULTISPECIES: GMC oxidoreductase [unclassified Cronobacter]ELQ6226718.1 GMC family oxidoreductase [Cronobacter turicensis]ELY4159239.1 GMC family oxidoreductase [Cronobacter turicensis]ELY4385388.1 GMC family oxidoreductase [Cronobacter turicensis]ELY6272280.1 GMC family oxidoreductase [Cronobacter turicensis]KAF6592065.1 GMC family oxidoreductase [Cronobacter sp. EKM101R]
MKDEVEIVVIGSGFGGAIAAKRLVEAGREVVMLERGPWRDTVPNRSIGCQPLVSLPQGWKLLTHSLRSVQSSAFRRPLVLNTKGFIEAYKGRGINIICSSGVGGGSHIYAAMLARPVAPDYWDGHHQDITAQKMDGYYKEMVSLLNARSITPDDRVPNAINETCYDGLLSTDGLPAPLIGVLFPDTPGHAQTVVDNNGVARQECDYRNNSVLGSPSGAKTTLDFAAIWPAIQSGLDLREMCEVTSLLKLTDAPDGMRYEILYKDHRGKTHRRLRARHVILAAGCLNTVRLLLQSRATKGGVTGMPRLGEGFGTNGGFFGFWRENSDRDLSVGLPLSGPFRARGSKSQSVLMLRAAMQGLDDFPLPGWLRKWTRRNSFLVGLGKDNNNGTMQLNKGRFRVTYDKKSSHVYQEIEDEMNAIRRLLNTKIVAPSSPLTVQPLGGACLGASNADGVIGANGEIFDNPGLYVADAAALPESPGRPPSLTIAVWAAQVADALLETLSEEDATHSGQEAPVR